MERENRHFFRRNVKIKDGYGKFKRVLTRFYSRSKEWLITRQNDSIFAFGPLYLAQNYFKCPFRSSSKGGGATRRGESGLRFNPSKRALLHIDCRGTSKTQNSVLKIDTRGRRYVPLPESRRLFSLRSHRRRNSSMRR